jgi:glycosyltransferase involved in cell wall biosynthesis
MTDTLPLLTIVTPSFNQGHFIEETIQSILRQGYPRLEHIVMDGGSTDDTTKILKNHPHIQWFSEKDRGQTHAVNKGFMKATGEIVGWINSDDTFLPGAFDAVIEAFRRNPSWNVIYGDYEAIDEKGNILYKQESFCGSYEEMIRWWDYTYAIHQPTVFVRKHVIDTIGMLDESFHYTMDYDWWLRIAKQFPFHKVILPLATYRFHKDSKSFAPLEQDIYPDQLRASKKHWGPFWKPRYWMMKKSYQAFLLRKPKETMHNPALESWYIDTQKNKS